MNQLSVSEKVVLELLRSAFWSEHPTTISTNSITDKIWQEIYSLSVSQGVQAIAFDGLIKLPRALHPPKHIMLAWAVNVRVMENQYENHCEVVSQLKKLLEQDNIDMLLLKGAGLSSCYPIPAHREYGDIDIYLFGKHKEGDKCIQDSAGLPPVKGTKHSSFYFRDIPVENHFAFLNIHRFKTFLDNKRIKVVRDIDESLCELLKTEGVEWLFLRDKEQIMIPSATFNFIFFTCHTSVHLPRKIVLRHLCDWTCFLYANKGKYNEKLVDKILHSSNFKKMVTIQTKLVIKYLGLPDEYAPLLQNNGADKDLEQRVLLNILRPFPVTGSSSHWSAMVIWKTKRFLQEHWKYKLVYGENILERAIRSLFWQCKKWYSSFQKEV